jgi:hypothetical protein
MSCHGGLTRPLSGGGELIDPVDMPGSSAPLLRSGQLAREPGSAGSGRWVCIGNE